MTASIFDQHKEVMLGDRLVSSNDGYMVYKVKILEDSNIEGDPKYPCKDYKIIGEYAKCLENEIVKLRQGSGKDRQGMAVKVKGLKA